MSVTIESNFSRRAFLAGSTVAAAALATRPVFGQAAPEPKKLGYAIVGIGSLAMHQILPGFAKAKLSKPVALVSGHPDKAKQQAALYGIDPKNIYNYDNYDSIKDNPDIDVVYIVLPNSMHAEFTIRAAKAGKHVLCEKPMACSVADCQAMIDACNAAKRKLLIAYRMHYDPITENAIKLARSQTDTGKLKMITAECGYNMGDPTQWRCNKALAGGGSLMDMGIYALNAARFLSGEEPSELAAMSYTTPNDPRFKDIEETINFELKFPSGVMASCQSSYGFSCIRYRVYGTRGSFESEPFQSYTGNHLYQNKRGRVEVPFTPIDQFAAEMDHLSECAMQGKTPLTAGEEGLKDIKLIMAAYESAATGKTIKLA